VSQVRPEHVAPRAPAADAPIWTPAATRVAGTHLAAFARAARSFGAPNVVHTDGSIDYAALHAWSVSDIASFWLAVWHFCGVRDSDGASPTERKQVGVGLDRMAPPDEALGPRWFPDVKLNYAEHLLRGDDTRVALIAWSERGAERRLDYQELRRAVARVAEALRRAGVGPGDRVAAMLPNIPESVIAMLAASSIGAIWSACSPDFGTGAVIDRFGQIAPKVLFVADGYRYAGKAMDTLPRAAEVIAMLPSVERVVVIPWLRADADDEPLRSLPRAVTWDEFVDVGEPALQFVPLPFAHALCIVYSSGTTGLPKCMVHSAGGALLQHLKELMLHTDLHGDDRIFYFTTCGWMMWNWLISSLAVGATLVLYDGSPLARGLDYDSTTKSGRADILWDLAAREEVSIFGTSAKYLALLEKEGVTPARTHDLRSLRTILSTGSPLAESSFDYVYRDVKQDVHLASISGGTDLLSCFVLGVPTAPVWRGEIQGAGLGMAVESWSRDGQRVIGAPGELVCRRPFPSMPVSFWNDADGSRYRAAYFESFPAVWRHGDWIEETLHGGYIILGRSDATLNPGGVRIGTAEIYRQVEALPEIVECVAVGQEVARSGTVATDGTRPVADVRIVLFVRLRSGLTLDDELRDRIRQRIREYTSPHHVPRKVIQVADLPRTISGKISEIAVREAIHGRPIANVDALANPQSLDLFRNLPELSS